MDDTSPNVRSAKGGWSPFRGRTLLLASAVLLPLLGYLSFDAGGIWISFAVLGLVIVGIATQIDQRGIYKPRILSKGRLARVRSLLSRKRPRRPLNHRGRVAVALVQADQSAPPIQERQDAEPSRSWQKRKDDAWMLKLLGLMAWIAIVIPGLNHLYNNLSPYWYRQSKGLPIGGWLCLILLGLSVVPLLLTLSFIDKRLIQR